MNDVERDIAATLTRKVPLLSLQQVARTWFGRDERAAEERLERLCRTAWLRRHAVLAHPELELEAPLGEWVPGAPAPLFGHLAHKNRARWQRRPCRTVVFVATEQASHVYGGRAGKPKPLHLSHDLNLAGVYLRLVAERPQDAALWVSEHELAPDREDDILPDAALRDARGELRRVIEFVGSSYTAERLEELYLDCRARAVPLEYW